MKKLRGFRIGRKLVRLYRRLLCRRRRPRRTAYIRMGAASWPSPPAAPSSALYACSTHLGNSNKQATVTSRLFGWGRKLCPRPFRTGRLFQHDTHAAVVGGAKRYDRGVSAGTKLLPFDDRLRSQQHQSSKQQAEQQPCKPPKGHLVVYVGKGGSDGGPPPHRVVVPVFYFNHPLFGELLREAEQEYGFHHPGGITIPCPISDFESVRDRVAAASESASDLHVRTASGRIWRWH